MIKLALVGKSISHSRSPEIYRRYLGDELHYELLDYKESSEIPSALKLMQEFDGISITSPYKKVFLDQIKMSAETKKFAAINCLMKKDGEIWGENTDALALKDLLQADQKTFGKLNVIILGDGVMAQVTSMVLLELGVDFVILSRKNTPQLERLDLPHCFTQHFSNPRKAVVINTCAREYVFQGKIDSGMLFWDYNYHFKPHLDYFSSKRSDYRDGMTLLESQARYSLSFWFPNRIYK